MSELLDMIGQKHWVPARGKTLKDGEPCRIQWPCKDYLTGRRQVMEWREGVISLDTRHVRLDGYAVPFPKDLDALLVRR